MDRRKVGERLAGPRVEVLDADKARADSDLEDDVLVDCGQRDLQAQTGQLQEATHRSRHPIVVRVTLIALCLLLALRYQHVLF